MSAALNFNNELRGRVISEETRRNQVYEEARVFVLSLCVFGFVSLVALSLLQMAEFIRIRRCLALIPVIFVDSLFFYFKVSYFIELFQKLIIFEILTSFFDLLTWIILLIYCASTKISLFLTFIPLGISIILNTLIFQEDSSALKIFRKVIHKQYKIILQCLGFLTLLSVGLKIENYIEMNWNVVLVPVWIILLAIALKSIMLLAYIISGLAYTESASTKKNKLILVVWSLYSTLGSTVSCIITIFFAINHSFRLAYIPVIAFLTVFELLTLLIFNIISEFVTDCFFTPTPNQRPENQNPVQGDQNENLENDQARLSQKDFRFIKRVNSVYFKPAKETELLCIEKHQAEERIKTKSCEILLTEEGNEEEKDSWPIEKECLICLDLLCNVIIIPCGHGGICKRCAKKLAKTKKPCHICRGKIEKIMKVRVIKSKPARVEQINKR